MRKMRTQIQFKKQHMQDNAQDAPRISEAIAHFNRNRGSKPKMTQKTLGGQVMPDMDIDQAARYITQWKSGKSLGYFKPHHVRLICQLCGVDANFIFNIIPV